MALGRAVLLLALVIAVSGCAGLGNVFGGDVINVQEKVVENGERDVIIVKEIQTIPTSPLLPDQQVVFSFILENRDNLASAETYVDLFNAPTMKDPVAGDPCNLYTGSGSSSGECGTGNSCVSSRSQCIGVVSEISCNSGNGICCYNGLPYAPLIPAPSNRICIPIDNQCGLGNPCPILPREEKPINFFLLTPSESDIKGIKTSTKLDFKTVYRFSSSLNYIVPAVSSDEVIKRQRTGDKVDLLQTKSYSSGPIQIDAELIGAPFIFSNGLNSPETIMTFKLRNRGSGTVVNSEIKPGTMRIIFPPELHVEGGDKFTCTNGVCVNDKIDEKTKKQMGTIPLFRDESRSTIRFTVKVNQDMQEPFRSFPITATVDYDYELRNSYDVTINPFQNV